jgi:hypothetical protein
MKLLGIIKLGSDVTDQLSIRFPAIVGDVTDQVSIRFPAIVGYWRRKWEYNETVLKLFTDFKKAYDSVMREVLYKILIEFRVIMKLVRLIKICLDETYSNVRIGIHLSDSFSFQDVLKPGDDLSPLLFKFALEYATASPRKPVQTEITSI